MKHTGEQVEATARPFPKTSSDVSRSMDEMPVTPSTHEVLPIPFYSRPVRERVSVPLNPPPIRMVSPTTAHHLRCRSSFVKH